MIQLKQDLQNPKTYVFIVAGIFIGIAIVVAATYFAFSNLSGLKQGNQAKTNGSNQNLPPGTAPVVEDYLKDIDPTKPYVDANGTKHPPIGAPVAPYNPNVKIEHPPVKGAAPVPPTAASAPTPKTPTPVTSGTSTR